MRLGKSRAVLLLTYVPDKTILMSRCPEVRVLDARKQSMGVMATDAAVALASEQGVDLIMLNPEAAPPLVRLVQFNKMKYEQSKSEKDQRKKQRESRWAFENQCWICTSSFH